MSAWVKCEKCGEYKEIPAYEGDGVFTEHKCEKPKPTESIDEYNQDEDEEEYEKHHKNT